MGIILYEISVQKLIQGIRGDIIIALLILLSLLAIAWQLKKKRDPQEKKKDIIILCGGSLIFLVQLTTIQEQYEEHILLSDAYETNSCHYVEGAVYDFRGPPDTAQWYEEFWVDEVFFSYSQYENTQGYYRPPREKGVIIGNGQNVRIGYVSFEIARMVQNKIVYIEQLE